MFELASLLLLLQNMLLEIEEKVLALSELSMQSENLLLEGRAETREEGEQLARKLRTLKGGLLELQRMLQDKQVNIQVKWLHALNVYLIWWSSFFLDVDLLYFLVLQSSLQEQEDSESDSSLSQSPSVQDWLAQARTTRSQQHQDSMQRQRVHFLFLFSSLFLY